VYQPITTLPGSDLYRTAVALYQRHRVSGGDTTCGVCGQPAPCPARRHAALVIRETGEDPRWYDEQLVRQHQVPTAHQHPSLNTPGVTGFAVGGYGRRADVPYVDYER